MTHWEFSKDKSKGNRPVMGYKKKSIAVVTYAFYCLNGRWPDPDKQLNHINSCNNSACWNPHHVYEGTHTDNMRDIQIVAGRLNWDLVDEIRELHRSGATTADLAVRFDMNYRTIWGVVNEKSWVR
jgi:hypothetical protein